MRKTTRNISRTGECKRDFKREAKGAHGRTLEATLGKVLTELAFDVPLDKRLVDHPLVALGQVGENAISSWICS